MSKDLFKLKKATKERENWDKKHPITAFIVSKYYSMKRFILGMKYWHLDILWAFQRAFTGHDNRYTCELSTHLAKFILPKLKRFRKMKRFGYCGEFKSFNEWNKAIDKMIYSMERIAKEDMLCYENKKGKTVGRSHKQVNKISKQTQEGLDLFGHHFWSLWD
jgi:hypothetical protein